MNATTLLALSVADPSAAAPRGTRRTATDSIRAAGFSDGATPFVGSASAAPLPPARTACSSDPTEPDRAGRRPTVPEQPSEVSNRRVSTAAADGSIGRFGPTVGLVAGSDAPVSGATEIPADAATAQPGTPASVLPLPTPAAGGPRWIAAALDPLTVGTTRPFRTRTAR
ncbi:hypothetical protein ACNS7O_04125 [Haloferacaceae archaeon DSL9]